MAIQRLHKKGATYSRGKDRMMNQAEFETTLNNALAYIQLKATPEQVSRLFKEIDLEKTGWISYEVYFLFLVYYFGSLRGTPYPENKNPYVDPDKAWLDSLSGLSPLDRLIRLLLDQLVQIFARYDSNKNMVLEEDEIEAILRHVLGLNDTEVSYLMLKYFNLSQKANKCMTFTELAKLLMEIYFI
jgi:Ca2+-binding EF-hand superfamily protein